MDLHNVRAAACLLLLLVASEVHVSRTAPLTRYDQRQEGELNVHAHLENFLILLIPSGGSGLFNIVGRIAPNRKHTTIRVDGQTGHGVAGQELAGQSGAGVTSPPKGVKAPPYKVDIDADKHGSLVVELNPPHEVVIAESPSVSLKAPSGVKDKVEEPKEEKKEDAKKEEEEDKKEVEEKKEEEEKDDTQGLKHVSQDAKSRASRLELLRTGLEPAPAAPCGPDEQRDRQGRCRAIQMPTRISKSYPSAELLKSLRQGLVPAH